MYTPVGSKETKNPKINTGEESVSFHYCGKKKKSALNLENWWGRKSNAIYISIPYIPSVIVSLTAKNHFVLNIEANCTGSLRNISMPKLVWEREKLLKSV